MATNKQLNWLDEHRGLAIVCVIAVFLVIFAISSMQQAIQTDKNPASASSKLETDSADVVKSDLDIYYLLNGKYPVTYERLVEDITNNKSGNYGKGDGVTKAKELDDTKGNLKDYNYTVRGDGQACQFTYLNSSNKTVTVAVDYKSEYH